MAIKSYKVAILGKMKTTTLCMHLKIIAIVNNKKLQYMINSQRLGDKNGCAIEMSKLCQKSYGCAESR